MDYFAKIKEPKKLRIAMMQVAKESIIISSIDEDIGKIRLQKAELLTQIKDDFKQIDDFCKFINDSLADEKVRKEIIAVAKTFKPKEEAKKPKIIPEVNSIKEDKAHKVVKSSVVPPQKAKTEIDRLDYTLSQIEKKIADLSK